MNVFDSIRRCSKVIGCWGDLNPKFYRPIVVPFMKPNPKVMIVTKQANPRGEGNTDSDWDPTRKLLEYLVGAKKGKPHGIARGINEMFNGAFLTDFDEKNKGFNKFYWAHCIKCPGNVRRKNEFHVIDSVRHACADKWLLDEIQAIKPKLIVTFGELASTWLLNKIDYKGKWTDRVWEEFTWIIKGKGVSHEDDLGGVKAKLVVALHPSGQNRLSRTFNKRIAEMVIDSFNQL